MIRMTEKIEQTQRIFVLIYRVAAAKGRRNTDEGGGVEPVIQPAGGSVVARRGCGAKEGSLVVWVESGHRSGARFFEEGPGLALGHRQRESIPAVRKSGFTSLPGVLSCHSRMIVVTVEGLN
jgi:hypothetical protein